MQAGRCDFLWEQWPHAGSWGGEARADDSFQCLTVGVLIKQGTHCNIFESVTVTPHHTGLLLGKWSLCRWRSFMEMDHILLPRKGIIDGSRTAAGWRQILIQRSSPIVLSVTMSPLPDPSLSTPVPQPAVHLPLTHPETHNHNPEPHTITHTETHNHNPEPHTITHTETYIWWGLWVISLTLTDTRTQWQPPSHNSKILSHNPNSSTQANVNVNLVYWPMLDDCI